MNYEYLKEAIVDAIKENHRQEITGDLLQQILLGMVDNMTTYRYMGIATTETHPVGTDSNIMFVASESGTYTYMGGLTVGANEFAILKRDTEWHKDVLLTSATTAKAGLFTAQDKGRLDTYEARYSQLATAIAQALDDVTAALADIQDLKTEIEEIKETVITAVQEATSAAQSATTAANLAQQKAEAAETAATEAEEKIEEMNAIAEELEQTVEEQNTRIGQAESDVNAFGTRLTTAEGTIAQAVEQVGTAVQTANTAVTNANEALEEVDELKEQVEAYIGMGKEQVVVTLTSEVEFPPKRLPDGFTELKFIESTGTQWIDTGIVPFDGIKAALTIIPNIAQNRNTTIFGIGGDYGWGTYFASNTIWDNYNDDTNTTLSTLYSGMLTIFKEGNLTRLVSSDFSEKRITRTNTLPTQSLSIYLFNKNGSQRDKGSFKCFGLTITDANDEPIFTGVPCRRDSDGEVGMYDMVSGEFLTNQGTGEFISGGAVAHGLSNQVLNVYLNDSDTPDQYETDERGTVAFRVDSGYKYRIVFPDIEGCAEVPDAVHTASVAQRSIEVEYVEAPELLENVSVYIRKYESKSSTPYSGKTVSVTVDGTTTTYTTDANGKAAFQIELGKTYTVSVATETGYYLTTGSSKTFTAEKSARSVFFNFHSVNVGIFIMDRQGNEYTLDEWVASGKQPEDTDFMKFATANLVNNNGVFYIKHDDIANKTYATTRQWCNENVQFNSIPLNGNSTTAQYYYDGQGATDAIIDEAEQRHLTVAAATFCKGQTAELGDETLTGFLWSVGQDREMYANIVMLDTIFATVRPDAVNNYTTLLNTLKWPSTQSSAAYAYSCGSGVLVSGKGSLYSVVVAYA